MADLPDDLRLGLAAALDAEPERQLSAAVGRLMAAYRSGRPADVPIVTSQIDAAAYAAYRMPATFAAVRAALAHLASARPGFQPRRLLDVGGGTGAAGWAACEVFPGLAEITVLDQVEEALALGRRLAGRFGAHPALRTAAWRRWRCAPQAGPPSAGLPSADLITISYLLGELPPATREALVAQAAATGATLMVVEAGTPAGHERVLAARAGLFARGYAVLAPCPHAGPCPLVEAGDWCHFAARVNRSALHRRLKQGRLGHEDEKFSYLAAAPHREPAGPPPAPAGGGPVEAGGGPAAPDGGPPVGHRSTPDGGPAGGTGPPAAGRVLRHPQFRKGVVTLEVCAADGTAGRELVSRRQGETYRLARDTGWGDPWPQPESHMVPFS